MNRAELDYFKEWFSEYVATFRSGDRVLDKTIALKEAHTRRVCKEIRMISGALKLSDDAIRVAETTALFHDVGRFRQYRDYGTFNDAASRNHAELGLDVLAENQVLSRCGAVERHIVQQAIRYHNMRVLPQEQDAKIVLFAKLLRDADKLDIWRVFVDYYEGRYADLDSVVVWGLPDEPVWSAPIIDALYARKMADTKHMATLNDFKLLQISWVFDVNFAPTFRAVQRRGYLAKIAQTLPPTPEIEKAVDIAGVYVDRRQLQDGESDLSANKDGSIRRAGQSDITQS